MRNYFDAKAFYKTRGIFHFTVFVISIMIDLMLIWKMTNRVPSFATNSQVVHQIWSFVFIFFIIINFFFLKIWNLILFVQQHKKWKSGYVEFSHKGIIHCETRGSLSRNQVKWMRGYVNNDASKEYKFETIYRITEVAKQETTKHGAIIVYGLIERTYFDEYMELEMGSEGTRVSTLAKHKIPAFYCDMNEIERNLKCLIQV